MKIVNGTSYHDETPRAVIDKLEDARVSGARIRLFYGDQLTGRCWMEEYDTIGRVGRSTGKEKIPLLIKTSRSFGGGAILDHCIVKIMVGGRTVLQHPKFHMPEMTIQLITSTDYFGGGNLWSQGYTHAVYFDNMLLWAPFKTKEQAENYIAFMKGERRRK